MGTKRRYRKMPNKADLTPRTLRLKINAIEKLKTEKSFKGQQLREVNKAVETIRKCK